MKSTKIREIRSIIILAKRLIDESEKEQPKNINEIANKYAYQYGYLQQSIESIYQILKRDINKNKKLSTNE